VLAPGLAASSSSSGFSVPLLLAAGAAGIALSALLSGVVEVVGIALLVALVDAYSVVAGPTHTIVEHHERVLDAFTLGLQPPGANAEALLGVSDIVFLGLFCGAARRLGLRARLTWLATSASFGLTLALAYGFDVALPALPLLSAGFLAANGDLLLARLRRR
jgi:hypothetical protein